MDIKKLRWRARRGMRELDVLLNRFLDECYTSLDRESQARFALLLEQDDPSVYAWLTGRQSHDDPDMQDVINKIIAVGTCKNG